MRERMIILPNHLVSMNFGAARAASAEAMRKKTKTGEQSSIYVNGDLKIDYAAGCVYVNNSKST